MNKPLFVLLLMLISGTLPAEQKVIVYNWSEYIDESVLENFTEETGIKIEYSTFDSNEVMYSKLKLQKGTGYDIVVPSTYYISKMTKEGLLQKLDKSLLKNVKNLNPDLLNKDYDPGNQYSLPYLWGSTGICYNSDEVKPGSVTSWKDLWDPKWKGNLLFTDDVREVFHMALRINGHSGNSENPDEIKQAFELLKQVVPNVLVFNSEAPREPYLSGDVIVGMNWNGEVVSAAQENDAIRYVYPKEGAVFWVDSFAIPVGAVNVKNAHIFIDYMLRAEVAKLNTEYVGYASPNQAALPLLEKSTRENPVIFPPEEIIANGEFHTDIGNDALQLMHSYWEQLKTAN